jgi:hypothetical protein
MPTRRERRSVPLFTLIADYCGGTYVAQTRASSPIGAVRSFASKSSTPKDLLGPLKQLAASHDKPVPIAECKNVWCASASYRGNLLLLNVIRTAGGAAQRLS